MLRCSLVSVMLAALAASACGSVGANEETETCTASRAPGEPAIVAAGASGAWSDPSLWGGCLPGPETPVTIERGASVTLDVDACVDALVIEGELELAEGDLELCARYVMVHGTLSIGRENDPYEGQAVITLVGDDVDEDIEGMGTKFLGVHGGGRLELHGTPPQTPWTTLAGAVSAGAAEITVVDASGWKVGDSIVIASGSVDPDEAEVRTIASLDGTRLMLDEPLRFGRDGTLSTIEGRTVDMRAEVGNLTRNIVIRGDEASTAASFGGHVMIIAGGVAHVDGVAFQRMGQFDRAGRYPFHWHVVGDGTGQYIRRSVVDGSLQRGIVVHDTSGVRVEGNIVRDSHGHGYIVETPETTDNAFIGNLAVGSRIAVMTDEVLREQGDNEAANFWIRSARNTFEGNHAAGSSGNGFWYDEVSDGPTEFVGNVAHSAAARGVGADFVRESGLLVVQTPGCEECLAAHPLEFRDSLVYESDTGLWPAEGRQTYTRFTVVGPQPHSLVTAESAYDVDFIDPLLVSGVGRGEYAPSAVLVQYASKVNLVRPVFVGYGDQAVLQTNDIFVSWQADVSVQQARFVDTDPAAAVLPDVCLLELLDDTYGTPGFYVMGDEPLLAAPGMTQGEGYFWGPQRVGYAEIMTRVDGELVDGPGSTIRRSDGLEYADDHVEGFRVIYDQGLSYELQAAPAGEQFQIGLHRRGAITQTAETPSLHVSLPLPAAPQRIGLAGSTEADDLPEDAEIPALSPASALEEVALAPRERYFYDAEAQRLHVYLTDAWLVVTP